MPLGGSSSGGTVVRSHADAPLRQAPLTLRLHFDYSLVNALILIVTLLGNDVLLSVLKQRWVRLAQPFEGVPVVIVEDGRLLRDRMDKSRVDEEDIMSAAREAHGLERMDQVKYAVQERSGRIGIVSKS